MCIFKYVGHLFEFYVVMSETTSNKSSSCSCINQCQVISFFPALSSSQLTYINGAESDSYIVGQFNESSEIAARTDDEEMMKTVELLTKVMKLNIEG